jgi:hypothetical protein
MYECKQKYKAMISQSVPAAGSESVSEWVIWAPQQLATLGKSEVSRYQLKAPDLLESWICKAVDKGLIYIYTIELGAGNPLSKPMMKAPPAFGWLLLGLVCCTVRTVSADKFCTARVAPSLLDAMKCWRKEPKAPGQLLPCPPALPCAAHEQLWVLCCSTARWLLTPTHVVVLCFFLGVCWVSNALLLFTYRALPAVNDATPVLHFLPKGGIHCVTLRYAVLLLVSTGVKESSAQWEYTHPQRATKNKYVSSYFPHPDPSLRNPPPPPKHFVDCTRGFFFQFFVKYLDWSSSTSRMAQGELTPPHWDRGKNPKTHLDCL